MLDTRKGGQKCFAHKNPAKSTLDIHFSEFFRVIENHVHYNNEPNLRNMQFFLLEKKKGHESVNKTSWTLIKAGKKVQASWARDGTS